MSDSKKIVMKKLLHISRGSFCTQKFNYLVNLYSVFATWFVWRGVCWTITVKSLCISLIASCTRPRWILASLYSARINWKLSFIVGFHHQMIVTFFPHKFHPINDRPKLSHEYRAKSLLHNTSVPVSMVISNNCCHYDNSINKEHIPTVFTFQKGFKSLHHATETFVVWRQCGNSLDKGCRMLISHSITNKVTQTFYQLQNILEHPIIVHPPQCSCRITKLEEK